MYVCTPRPPPRLTTISHIEGLITFFFFHIPRSSRNRRLCKYEYDVASTHRWSSALDSADGGVFTAAGFTAPPQRDIFDFLCNNSVEVNNCIGLYRVSAYWMDGDPFHGYVYLTKASDLDIFLPCLVCLVTIWMLSWLVGFPLVMTHQFPRQATLFSFALWFHWPFSVALRWRSNSSQSSPAQRVPSSFVKSAASLPAEARRSKRSSGDLLPHCYSRTSNVG